MLKIWWQSAAGASDDAYQEVDEVAFGAPAAAAGGQIVDGQVVGWETPLTRVVKGLLTVDVAQRLETTAALAALEELAAPPAPVRRVPLFSTLPSLDERLFLSRSGLTWW